MSRPSLQALTCLLLSFFAAAPLAPAQTGQPKPWPIRAVIITTFEKGADTGDDPGEFQLWVEREHLSETLPFVGNVHPLRINADHTVLGVVSGTTLVNAASSLTALGLDPRFDLTHAYILINGIAGADPNQVSLGSAAWSRYVVNAVAHEVDIREAPKDWPYGLFPIGSDRPNPARLADAYWARSNTYTLNARLADWAFQQTRNLKLIDEPAVAALRARFVGYPNAQRPPFVVLGDDFASDHYWHGKILTGYAEDWVKLYTGGKGTFVMAEMEDAGFMAAAERLDAMHRIDVNRVMVLRTASNYTMQLPDRTAAQSIAAPYVGTNVALESAWLCGSTVLHKILADWSNTETHIPGN